MNTDNTSIAGETIDYGPCAFMDHYHPDTVYSSIDHMGRYAYSNQPPIAMWNLGGLGNALLPSITDDPEAAVEPDQLEQEQADPEAKHERSQLLDKLHEVLGELQLTASGLAELDVLNEWTTPIGSAVVAVPGAGPDTSRTAKEFSISQ